MQQLTKLTSFKDLDRIVCTVETPLRLGHDDEAHLRIEILESLAIPGRYRARIWRLESYRIQSTFPQERGTPAHQPSDELILKAFESFESPLETHQTFANEWAAAAHVLGELERWANTLRHDGGNFE